MNVGLISKTNDNDMSPAMTEMMTIVAAKGVTKVLAAR